MSTYSALAFVYDELSQNVKYNKRARVIDRFFKKNNVSGIVLDAGCGTGTLSLLLEKRGYDVIGVDISQDMLSVAYDKASAAVSKTIFLNQDLAELDLFGTVNGIVCMQDTLNHVGDSLSGVIERFSLFIEKDGILIFDLNTHYKHENVLADSMFVYEYSNGVCVWYNEYEPQSNRIKLIVEVFSEDGEGSFYRASDVFYEYTVEPSELEQLLGKNGFEIITKLDGESYRRLRPNSERVLYVAKKIK
jgi:2-polyprenyl-3-methyl-5-hydroxy-6-metoxy-1,4-benzoquinol methylase